MLTYEQSTGRLYDGNNTLLGTGYAGGDCGNAPDGINNPALQNVPNVGPLPCGIYKIGQPYDHPRCGPYFLPLLPAPENEMFGRGGFGIHGDLIGAVGLRKASDGCPIQSLDVRHSIGEDLAVDDDLEVVAYLPGGQQSGG